MIVSPTAFFSVLSLLKLTVHASPVNINLLQERDAIPRTSNTTLERRLLSSSTPEVLWGYRYVHEELALEYNKLGLTAIKAGGIASVGEGAYLSSRVDERPGGVYEEQWECAIFGPESKIPKDGLLYITQPEAGSKAARAAYIKKHGMDKFANEYSGGVILFAPHHQYRKRIMALIPVDYLVESQIPSLKSPHHGSNKLGLRVHCAPVKPCLRPARPKPEAGWATWPEIKQWPAGLKVRGTPPHTDGDKSAAPAPAADKPASHAAAAKPADPPAAAKPASADAAAQPAAQPGVSRVKQGVCPTKANIRLVWEDPEWDKNVAKMDRKKMCEEPAWFVSIMKEHCSNYKPAV